MRVERLVFDRFLVRLDIEDEDVGEGKLPIEITAFDLAHGVKSDISSLNLVLSKFAQDKYDDGEIDTLESIHESEILDTLEAFALISEHRWRKSLLEDSSAEEWATPMDAFDPQIGQKAWQ